MNRVLTDTNEGIREDKTHADEGKHTDAALCFQEKPAHDGSLRGNAPTLGEDAPSVFLQ